MTRVFLFLCAAAGWAAISARAETYYVSKTGSDTNSGAEGSPFASVWKAVDAAVDGDTILVGDGTFYFPTSTNECITVSEALTIRSVNGLGSVEIRGQYLKDGTTPTARNRRVLRLNNAAALVSGLVLSTATSAGDEFQSNYGGGAYVQAGTLTNCVVRGCACFGYSSGIHITDGLVTHCVISNNTGSAAHQTSVGVGMTGGKLENCLIADNRLTVSGGTSQKGGGIFVNGAACAVRNCTVVKNKALRGAGIYVNNASAQIVNCISYGNIATVVGTDTSAAAPNYWSTTGKITNLCTTATIGVVMDGEGLAADQTRLTGTPGFKDFANNDYKLDTGSRCLDIAYGASGASVDLAGSPRVSNGRMDLGCYEMQQEALKTITIEFTPEGTVGTNQVLFVVTGFNLTLIPAACYWTLDGRAPSAEDYDFTGDSVEVTVPPGAWTPSCTAVVDGESYTKSSDARALTIYSPKVFILPANANARFPYDTWEIAATNIASALSIATDGTEVTFGDGKFYSGVSAGHDVAVGAKIRSLNGAAKTVIDGKQYSSRFFVLRHGDAELDGFTFANGATRALEIQKGTLKNSVVTNCWAWEVNGGAIYAPAGANRVVISNCVVSANRMRPFSISQTGSGIGIYASGTGALVENCELKHNTHYFRCTTATAGALALVSGATARNCLVVGNTNAVAGGVYLSGSSRLENSTVAGNTGAWDGTITGDFSESDKLIGGGVFARDASSAVVNCIIIGNATGNATLDPTLLNASGAGAYQTNAIPEDVGTACITADPCFVEAAADNYRLTVESPCRNKAALFDWMASATDLDGNARILKGRPDLGCYECTETAGFLLIMR